ncbi:putative reverse transcriptase domain-containing protein [Tanacetum coccineum]
MSRYRLAPLEMQELSEQLRELQDKVVDALSRKERVKPRRVRAMAMTIQYGVRGMKLAAQSEAFKQENVMMRTIVMDEAHASRYLVKAVMSKTFGLLQYLSENEIESPWILSVNFQGQSSEYDVIWVMDVHLPLDEFSYNNSYRSSIRCAPFEALYGRKCRSPVLWAEVRESSLIGPELVQEKLYSIASEYVAIAVDCLSSERDLLYCYGYADLCSSDCLIL